MGAGSGLLAVLVVVLVVGTLVAVVMAGVRGSGTAPGKGDAERILAERFARGELSSDEYERCLRTLGATRPPQ